MRRPFSVPPTSSRVARISILVTVLFNYLIRQFVLTGMQTWSGWSKQPDWFWRPFTVGTLFAAALGALFWPWLGGDLLFESIFGVPIFSPIPGLTGSEPPFFYLTISYIVWSALLLPHTLVRLGFLICTRLGEERSENRTTDN
jgi:hypothetical protein